jgi:dTDP-4-amino-4,6-dideoxygalactose transaminase
MARIISASLSPNTQRDDVTLAFKTALRPWTWREGREVAAAEEWFCAYFSTGTAVSFNSGRSALLALLKSFGVGAGDEVLLQAFTCVAVPNSVLWAGATPRFVDIDETYNLDPKDLVQKITKKTKVIIVQHTFGIPANLGTIIALAQKHNLIVIEDCAHALGASYKGHKVGSLGDAAFFSFGRDKVLSSVWGGMAIVNTTTTRGRAATKLKEYQHMTPMPGGLWIAQQLRHPIAFSAILATYTVGFGKALLVALQKLHLLSFPVYPEEKLGKRPQDFPARFPNALAILLLNQLKKLDAYNAQRRKIARYYAIALARLGKRGTVKTDNGALFLRFPLEVKNQEGLLRKAKRRGILLGNWYHNIVDPTGVELASVGYVQGSCPKAEKAAAHIVNLPTLIDESQARRVVEIF